jgi:hypothetical protein
VALANRIAAPEGISADLDLFTATSVNIQWREVPDADLPTQGYFVEQLSDEDKWLRVFDASQDPNALSAQIRYLMTGKTYFFRVFSLDFNSESEPSEII